MKTVIMAGGKGTRISSLTSDVPKPMINICGKPVIQHQIEQLKNQNIVNITITVGHMWKVITDYLGDGKRFGVHLEYIIEKEPLGTAGALAYFRECGEDVLLINGDLFFDVDIKRFYEFHKYKNAEITLMTHPNNHPYDSTIIVADSNGKVTNWIERDEKHFDYKNRVNAGIHLLSPAVLSHMENKAVKLDLDRDIIRKAMNGNRIFIYDTSEYIKDMGTPERYQKICREVQLGYPEKRNINHWQKAVFLDRDGTINAAKGFINQAGQMELIPGVADVIRKINESEYLAIVITNQPVIARGECTCEELDRIHQRMERLLGEQGAYIDDLFFCPHHPDQGFEGEVAELKIQCNCRKPLPGMLLNAAEKHHINLQDSYMIGDSESDVLAGKRAGCRTILAKSGLTMEVIDKILGY